MLNKIKKIKINKIEVYNPNNLLIGIIENESELAMLQYDIAKNSFKGHYLIYDEVKIEIDSKGNLNEWPKGMMDDTMVIMSKIFNLRRNVKLTEKDEMSIQKILNRK